ncbi:MAG TPA: hypothetical protein VMN03_13790 [Burkholderiales bacterium]|nr:hypothetical protein [Burkholderiales bacterium]
MPEPTRERHRQVLRVLQAMNPALLESTRCFFAGGTRIVLELQEYRESAESGVPRRWRCGTRVG